MFCPKCCAEIIAYDTQAHATCANHCRVPTDTLTKEPDFRRATDDAVGCVSMALRGSAPRSFNELDNLAYWLRELAAQCESQVLVRPAQPVTMHVDDSC